MNAPAPPLIPPRPIPDPVPWTEPTSNAWVWPLAALLAVGLILTLGRRFWIRHRTSSVRPIEDPLPGDLIAWTERARQLLAKRVGPAWRARTTEEMARDAVLAERLGAERFALLIARLSRADRLKFSSIPQPSDCKTDGQGFDGPSWLADLEAALGSEAAGASSTIKGK